MTGWTITAAALLPVIGFGQARTLEQGGHRMEIKLERLDSGTSWKIIEPGLVLAQGDRVRFRFRANFDGYLYVSNYSSSGKDEQLFPAAETGRDNRIIAAHEYAVPATSAAFRIAGPPGYETVYWLVSPARLSDAAPWRLEPPKLNLTPRCDDAILRARGDCVDSSAGPKLVPREIDLPWPLAQAAGQGRRDLVFMRQEETAVISSPSPLTGPVVYEFRLAHR